VVTKLDRLTRSRRDADDALGWLLFNVLAMVRRVGCP
jgi:hypothetical protein